jgi:Flp pilus assembly protein TadG
MSRDMTCKSLLARLGASFVRLGRDERGVSAVEFAMLLPLMLSLYLGAVEVSQAVAVDRKVTLAARAVADLVSQVKTIDNTELANVVDAATNVVAPFPESNLKITITAIKIDGQGNVTTVWKYSGATGAVTDATTPQQAIDSRPALKVANSTTYLIWGQAEYSYKPVVGYVITGTLTLRDQIFMRPRLSDDVQKT